MARTRPSALRAGYVVSLLCLLALMVGAHDDGGHAAVAIDAAGQQTVQHVHEEKGQHEHVHDHGHAEVGVAHEHAVHEHAGAVDGHEHEHEDGHAHHEHDHHDHDHHDHDDHDHHHDHEHEHEHAHTHAEEHTHNNNSAAAGAHHHHHHGHSHSHGGHGHSHDIHRVLREDEKHPWTAIALTFLSGGAAVLGGLLVVCMGTPSPAAMGHMLSFAAGIMLYISYGDMLTHAVMDMSGEDDDGFFPANAWMCAGMLIFWVIATLIPAGEAHAHGGAEHSHVAPQDTIADVDSMHAPMLQVKLKAVNLPHDGARAVLAQRYKQYLATAAAAPTAHSGRARRTLMTGMIAAVGITLHNMPEGLIVYNQTITGICAPLAAGTAVPAFNAMLLSLPAPFSSLIAPIFAGVDVSTCLSRGVAVTFAIFLHNIPEGAAVASAMYADTHNAWQAMKWCIVSALAEPVTAVVFGWAFSQYLTPYLVALLNAVVAGIMICLCIIELMPAACELIDPKWAALSNIAGQIVMFLSLHFMRHTGMH